RSGPSGGVQDRALEGLSATQRPRQAARARPVRLVAGTRMGNRRGGGSASAIDLRLLSMGLFSRFSVIAGLARVPDASNCGE
ncbi:hypothetical protein, partial [Bradyrhizobium brasilense]|uniref:hypothetical protein n=1 Tax=Bradyrhizobium brasilense TaxID=1419277 RepID=UPI001E44431D